MKKFTGFEYLLIDAASQFGLDKLTFEKRIEWAKANMDKLETLQSDADTKTAPLYAKAVLAIRKAQQRIPTGHMVGVDASASGIQLMSVLTGCQAGAENTGLIDPNKRADIYTQTTEIMNIILGGVGLNVERKDAKGALMTAYYGSRQIPKDIFGEDTQELTAFYVAMAQVAPGAWELLQLLLQAWKPFALVHEWKLPDGYDARVKVMTKKRPRIEVQELGGASFTYEYYENEGTKTGVSLAANVIHSCDAYVLREMHRRCNYDLDMVQHVSGLITDALKDYQSKPMKEGDKLGYYIDQYNRSTLASTVILPYIIEDNVSCLTQKHLQALQKICLDMLSHKSFPLVTIHDEFKAHPNNVNQVRYHYKEILADMADSNMLDDLLNQLYGQAGTYQKLSSDLANKIRNSAYALC